MLDSPVVMGVLNITPDSFSDGGTLHRNGRPDLDKILQRAEQILIEGAGIIDVGGESTRPGANVVSVAEELDRVLPVVEAITQRFKTIVSIDTSSPELIREAAACGGAMINDVRALERPGALAAARQSGLPICLMHMHVSQRLCSIPLVIMTLLERSLIICPVGPPPVLLKVLIARYYLWIPGLVLEKRCSITWRCLTACRQ